MPQNPLAPQPGGIFNSLNVTATTVIKPTPGHVFRLVVNTAPSGAGGVYDNNSTSSGNTAANLIYAIPTTTTGVVTLEFPCLVGITVNPGTGGVVAVSYS